MTTDYRRLRRGCYAYSLTTAVLVNLSPVLFLTLRDQYGISYGALGALISLNFLTQLGVDLLFSFHPGRFDIPKVVTVAPLIAGAGLLVYGLWPRFFPETAYWGLLTGTFLFSAAGGLAEVLLSPVIAAIPAPDPDREMSKLHSAYAWGMGPVVLLSSAFLHLFGQEQWYVLPLLFALLPLTAFLLLCRTAFPEVCAGDGGREGSCVHNSTLWLCVAAIFLGGAAENTMGQWGSGYLEAALGIPKLWGDIFGVALFSLMLGSGRTLYSKFGSRVERFLLWGSAGAAVCYLTAALCPVPMAGLAACALTGLFTSLLWPGSLILAAEHIPGGGVVMYALLAAGGDLGSSVVPQLIGLITDGAIALAPAGALGLSAEQLGMKLGMLLGALCPLAAAWILRRFRRRGKGF